MHQHGFTLVELLVALALSGLVTTLLVGGIRLASLGLDRVSRGAERVDAHRSLSALLQRSLGATIVLPLAAAATSFIGDTAQLHFLTLAEDGGPGVYRIDLAFDAHRADRPLILTRRIADPLVPPQLQQSVLASRLRGVHLAYFGIAEQNAAPEWHDRWDSVRYPPQLVRLTIDESNGNAQPPILVRLWAAPG